MVKAELAELVAGAPMNPGDPETRCQYLEKLLEDGGEPAKGQKQQIARIHRNIETILHQKKNSSDL
ncbi:hypothetical protein WH47_00415 [Habropoda laboriosa]|uniref:Uncharacterized protein n=1 Tax=Habropoda laboriosa TaxID=597456 RepID=A0A0L7R763_9HYME|nr:hypothetical protein WH47_00415 [Habropoda laboriosa]